MLRAAGAGLLLLAAGGHPPPRPGPVAPGYSRVIVREQIVVRVSRRGRDGGAFTQADEWKEHKGPRCVPARALAGAALSSPNSVDFLLRDGARLRARLQSGCPALDYYYGFYITPNPDGLICADRDAIRSRVGGQCEIQKLRTLKPRRRRE